MRRIGKQFFDDVGHAIIDAAQTVADAPIVGATAPQHLDDAAAALTVTLSG